MCSSDLIQLVINRTLWKELISLTTGADSARLREIRFNLIHGRYGIYAFGLGFHRLSLNSNAGKLLWRFENRLAKAPGRGGAARLLPAASFPLIKISFHLIKDAIAKNKLLPVSLRSNAARLGTSRGMEASNRMIS